MCLLVVKPAGIELPADFDRACKNAADSNPHGFGFAISRGRRWRSHTADVRVMMSGIDKYITKDEPAILHWRYSTSGLINKENCHPFKISDGTVFAHNGVCSNHYPGNQLISDTAALALASADYNDLYSRCAEIASGANKFAILHPESSTVDIIGEEFGDWHNGIWFSNDTWRDFSGYSYHHRDDDYYENFFSNVEQAAQNVSTYSGYSNDYVQLQSSLEELIYTYGTDAVEAALNLLKYHNA